MASLTEEITAKAKADATAAAQGASLRQQQAIESMRKGFEYVFGEPAEKVEPYGREAAVAHMDGLRFVKHYGGSSGASGGLHVLCACKHCGHDFVSWESVGAMENHYGPRSEKPPADRRAYAVEQLAKLHRRDFQPNGHDHDHVCYAGAVDSVRSRVRSAAKATGLSQSEIIQRVLLAL
jgi:hypothetical protein